jgi:hypothetical protein
MNRVLASMLLCCSVVAQIDTFDFAGLSLRATMEELKVKYPRSTPTDGFIYLSDQDSHDDISTIGVSGPGSARTLTIHFERQRKGTPAYPACEKVLAHVQRRYGRPARIVDAQEEQSRNRRFEWNTTAETLTLSCFRMPRQSLYAERITIAVAVSRRE